MKQCTKCLAIKPLDDFYAHRTTTDGRANMCKQCVSIHNKQNKVKRAKNYSLFLQNNPDYKKRYRALHHDQHAAYSRRHYEKNKEVINHRCVEYRRRDLKRKLSSNLRARLFCALHNNQKTGSAVKDLGCNIDELRLHIESQWLPGMTWNNWGKYGWHIDHIIPLSSFDLSDPEQLKKACHYTNLQPLWWQDNLSKGGH